MERDPRLKLAAQVIGVCLVAFVVAVIMIVPTIRLEWSLIRERAFYLIAIAVVRTSADVSVKGAEKAKSLESSFAMIRDSVSGTVQAAKEIGVTTNQQASSSDQMVESISAIADNADALEKNATRLDSNLRELTALTEKLMEITDRED